MGDSTKRSPIHLPPYSRPCWSSVLRWRGLRDGYLVLLLQLEEDYGGHVEWAPLSEVRVGILALVNQLTKASQAYRSWSRVKPATDNLMVEDLKDTSVLPLLEYLGLLPETSKMFRHSKMYLPEILVGGAAVLFQY